MTTINVTTEHIKNATPRKCQHCVIALAINDVLKPPYIARAGLFVTSILVHVGPEDNDCEARQKLDIKEEFLKCSSESPPN